ncbi:MULTISPECIES: TRAP transporter large permease [Eubacteriales]|uniref:TRAP transporter large permease n=1 Tax=Lawsonibacter hominis TaxID=2763053 RepID=A0A8J6MAR5_9FIRM|nr:MULTISPECIES: TRAP transporter large permease [Eubacteriales]MBC5735291.1 TRAP transporter large permease [Lawsonibacter hominis]MDY3013595.1 TRAP transporter large permease [Evtepia sp.]
MECAILFIVFVVLLVFGVPIALCLVAAGALVILAGGDISPIIIGQRMFGSLDSFTIMAIPLFMLAGNLMSSGGISRRLVNFCNAILGWMPGGLGVVAVFACMLFGALSGSPTATCAAIGSIMVPSMIEAGYSKRFSLATVAVAGILGCIIPPSTVMVSYSSVSDASVGSMFMGGILPGILMGLAMAVIPIQYGIKHQAEIPRIKFSLRNLGKSTVDAIGALLMPIIILGGIYGGIFTPTEAAGVACAYGLIVGMFIYRELRLKELKNVLMGASSSTGMVLFIMACAAVFGFVMARYQITNAIAEFIISICPNKYIFLLLVNILLLIVGCFMETTAAILILAPIFAPILTAFGIHPVHFGVVMCINLAIGCATPPLGLNLFVAAGLTKDKVEVVISKHTVQYILLSIAILFLITYVPDLVMAIPNSMMG